MTRPYQPASHHAARTLVGVTTFAVLTVLIWFAADHHAGPSLVSAGIRITDWARNFLSTGGTRS